MTDRHGAYSTVITLWNKHNISNENPAPAGSLVPSGRVGSFLYSIGLCDQKQHGLQTWSATTYYATISTCRTACRKPAVTWNGASWSQTHMNLSKTRSKTQVFCRKPRFSTVQKNGMQVLPSKQAWNRQPVSDKKHRTTVQHSAV